MKQDPVIIYGPGIKNYFRMIEYLMVAFAVFSVLSFGQMYIFKQYNGLGNIKEYVSWTAENSIGNMGYTIPICVK